MSKKTLFRSGLALGIALLVGGAVFTWIAYEPALDPISKPLSSRFAPEQISRGYQLATVGDCVVCHTTDGGVPFAGSRALPTPFGTLYSTNITPDEETGIGSWSEAAFIRAMRRGVAQDGSHLYPALPYEHFTHVNDKDLQDLYAFFMTRQPTTQRAPANALLPGLGFRPLLAGWKLLFLRSGEFKPDMDRSDEWNRGRYLVDGLAHCGGCHTPRNIAGGEKTNEEFAGGEAEGWIAPPLNQSNPSAGSWTEASLYNYLKHGFDDTHGAAGGPMAPVSEGLSHVNDADVRAIALYTASVMGVESSARDAPAVVDNGPQAAKDFPAGAALFQGACAGCHEPTSPMGLQGRPPLSSLTSIKSSDPRNALAAMLQGLPAAAEGAPLMPGFANNFTDNQITDLLSYVRARFTHDQPWDDLDKAVVSARAEEH